MRPNEISLQTLVAEARRLVKLCQHALDVNDLMALSEMATEAQKRCARLHESAKRGAIQQMKEKIRATETQ